MNVKVIEILLDHLAHGWSPEEIHFQHPHLSMALIHAALTFYDKNQAQLDARIARELEALERLAQAAYESELGRKIKVILR